MFNFGDTEDIPNSLRNIRHILKYNMFVNRNISEIDNLEIFEHGPNNSEDPFNIFANLEYGIDVYPKTRNGYLVIWDQCLSKI